MNLSFLNRHGVKEFRNVLKYLNNPDSIKNPSQKTKISKEEFRKHTIANSFKHLTDEDKQLLIVYIKDKTNIIHEIIETFADFKMLEMKESIASFLHDLMKNVDDKNIKLKIFNLIFLNHPPYSLAIVYEAKIKESKKELCQSCILLNSERGYIYALLNNVKVDITDSLDFEKLVYEINYIQSFSKDLILEIVFKDCNDLENLIVEINNRIKDKDFQMFYTLAQNIELLNSYNFNVDKNELSLLKWVINITNNTEDDVFIEGIRKKDLESYSTEWLIFLAMNLLQMDAQKQKFSIIILNYLVAKEGFIERYSEKIAESISLSVKKYKEIRYELLEILGKLETTKGFYNIMDLIREKGISLIKNKAFKAYISKNIRDIKEYKWLDNLDKSHYIKPKLKLDSKAITFVLMEKTPKENYRLLKMLKEHEDDLYTIVMKNFEELIANKLDGYEEYIKLAIVLNYQCEDKNVLNTIKQYKSEKLGVIESFMKICDPKLIEDCYIKNIKKAIEKKDSQNIIGLLQMIEEPQIKNKCSWVVLENLIEDDFDELVDIWKYLTLNIKSKIKFRRKVLKMITNKEIQLTEKSINFINKVGLEPTTLYNCIEEQSQKEYLLNIWYRSNEVGKITNIMKEKITSETKSLDDLKVVCNLLESYNINDSNIDLLVKIKAYTMISIELSELDIGSEESIKRLNELGAELDFYGLIDRFLMDKFLQKEIDRRIVDYLFRRFMSNIDSDELWEYYWDNIVDDLRSNGCSPSNGKVEIFFNRLTKSKKGIEWFLDTIEYANVDHEIYMNILEIMLVLSNKQNRIILQNEQEIDQKEEKILTVIGKTIGEALSNMERTIINRSDDIENDILVENMKRFRRELKDVGIDSVEGIENYGRIVRFDSDIHKGTQLTNLGKGMVDSLGVGVNNKNILLSTLLNID